MHQFFASGNQSINTKVINAFNTAWDILTSCIENNNKMSRFQYDMLTKLCRDVFKNGSFEQKQQFCYILYSARAKSNNTVNQGFCLTIEKYFRELCRPFFNSEASFKNVDLDFVKNLIPNHSQTLRMEA